MYTFYTLNIPKLLEIVLAVSPKNSLLFCCTVLCASYFYIAVLQLLCLFSVKFIFIVVNKSLRNLLRYKVTNIIHASIKCYKDTILTALKNNYKRSGRRQPWYVSAVLSKSQTEQQSGLSLLCLCCKYIHSLHLLLNLVQLRLLTKLAMPQSSLRLMSQTRNKNIVRL